MFNEFENTSRLTEFAGLVATRAAVTYTQGNSSFIERQIGCVLDSAGFEVMIFYSNPFFNVHSCLTRHFDCTRSAGAPMETCLATAETLAGVSLLCNIYYLWSRCRSASWRASLTWIRLRATRTKNWKCPFFSAQSGYRLP